MLGFPKDQYLVLSYSCFILLILLNIANGISNNIRLFVDDTFLFDIIDDDVTQQTLSIRNDIDTIKNSKTMGCRL